MFWESRAGIVTFMPPDALVWQASLKPEASSSSENIFFSFDVGSGTVPLRMTRHFPQSPVPPQGWSM